MSNKSLTVVENFELPVLPEASIIEEEMDGLEISFERVKIPSAGGVVFEVPGDDDEDIEVTKEIKGVIVHHHPVNICWKDEYSGQSNPPDCVAMDGKIGVGNPGGPCSSCPQNKFGSGARGGKLCKNTRRLYILQEGDMFPTLLTLPTMSLANFGRYVSRRVLQRGLRTNAVITRISLKKAVSSGGVDYSQATFKLGGVLPEDTVGKMEEYGAFVKELAREVEASSEDYDMRGSSRNMMDGAIDVTDDDIPF